jgi:hypothetical protein
LVDGAGHVVTTSSAVITVGIAPGTGNGTLHGTTTATAINGVATFSDLSIDLEGTSYALRASSSGLTSKTSGTFRIDEAATVCTEDVTCAATLTDPDASLDVSAAGSTQGDSGVLTINRTAGATLDCAGYDELLDRDFTVDFVPNPGTVGRTKTVTLTIGRDAMKQAADNGVAHLEMCFGAPFMFAVKPNTPPLQQPTPGFFVGLLPDCGTPPCVSKRKGQGGAGIIVAQAPGGDQDPRYNG